MNDRIEQCLYLSGLTAQGCWDELDDYAKQGIHKFADLIVKECSGVNYHSPFQDGEFHARELLEHFGIEE